MLCWVLSDTPDESVSKGNEMEDTTTTPASDVEIGLAAVAYQAKDTFDVMFGIVWSEEWKSFELLEQIAFRDFVQAYLAQATIIREKFDADVWKGHANGTVDIAVESIRKEREGDAPGKKATPPTADSILAKRLKK
jgi:hypothetical protein